MKSIEKCKLKCLLSIKIRGSAVHSHWFTGHSVPPQYGGCVDVQRGFYLCMCMVAADSNNATTRE